MSILSKNISTIAPNSIVDTGGLYNSCSTTVPSIVNSNYSWSTGISVSTMPYISSPSIVEAEKVNLKGDNADITVNGKSLIKLLSSMQERLAMLEPNPALEKDWAELKQLGDKYRQLEAEIKEKLGVWDLLNNND